MGGHTLVVQVLGCKDLDSGHNIFEHLDPFVTVRYAMQQFQTKVADDGGKNPVFKGETFTIAVHGPPHVLEVVVQDKDKFSHSDFVGRAQIPFGQALETGEEAVDVPLKNRKGQVEGSIQLSLKACKDE